MPFSVQLPEGVEQEIYLVDINDETGLIVLRYALALSGNNILTISTRELNPGAYYLNVRSSKNAAQSFSARFIVNP